MQDEQQRKLIAYQRQSNLNQRAHADAKHWILHTALACVQLPFLVSLVMPPVHCNFVLFGTGSRRHTSVLAAKGSRV